MLPAVLDAVQSRIQILLLPLLTLLGGPKFDHYGWKNMKVAGTSSALEIIEVDEARKIENNMGKQNSGQRERERESKRKIGTDYLWSFIDMAGKNTVLEIGCLTGYRIFEQAKLYPNVQFVGVDISQDAVDTANLEAINQGISNVTFECYDVTSREFFEDYSDKRFDVIFSFATLICIHPFKIKPLIKFMLNNSNKQVIMIEQNNDKLQSWPFYLGVPIRNNPNWMRNYARTCNSVTTPEDFEFIQTSVPIAIWNAGGGHCTVVDITRVKSRPLI
jgi:SAM-dependent methyltransferase